MANHSSSHEEFEQRMHLQRLEVLGLDTIAETIRAVASYIRLLEASETPRTRTEHQWIARAKELLSRLK